MVVGCKIRIVGYKIREAAASRVMSMKHLHTGIQHYGEKVFPLQITHRKNFLPARHFSHLPHV
jgi:hypothetical protein